MDPALTNKVQFFDTLDEALAENEREASAHDAETCVALGACLTVAGLELEPPSLGVVMLLDLVKSPLLAPREDGKVDLQDLFEALLILKERNGVAHLLYRKAKGGDEGDLLWREAVADFACSLGAFSPEEATLAIGDYIGACFGGFAAMPSKGDESDGAKKNSTQNG
jgi:hypothetical protein